MKARPKQQHIVLRGYPECPGECSLVSSHGRWYHASASALWQVLSRQGRNCHSTIPHLTI